MQQHSHNMRTVFFLVLGFVAFLLAFHWSWNAAMPALFGLPAVGFKQSLGMVILLSIASVLLRRPRGRFPEWFPAQEQHGK